jgi:hypothetical protein
MVNNMEYSFTFIINSSINHFKSEEFSRYTTEQRFLQTIETIESIKSRVKNCKICLFELSQTPIKKEYKDEIIKKVDLFLEYHNDKEIKTLYKNFTNHPELFKYGKSLFELKGLSLTLDNISKNNLFKDSTRFFKITGRYKLNNFFNIKDYETKFLKGKYVIKYHIFSLNEPDSNVHYHVYQNKGSVITGLWSFDKNLFNETIRNLENTFLYLQNMLKYTNGSDIEHGLYKYLDNTKLINCDVLGLSIRKGMDFDSYDT